MRPLVRVSTFSPRNLHHSSIFVWINAENQLKDNNDADTTNTKYLLTRVFFFAQIQIILSVSRNVSVGIDATLLAHIGNREPNHIMIDLITTTQ